MSIKFLSRKEVLVRNLTLARRILDVQKVTYDPSEGLVNVGDSVYLEAGDDKLTVLTSALADKWNEEQVNYCNSMRDKFYNIPPEIDFCGNVIAELPLDNIADFVKKIGKKISLLFEQIGWKEILVISGSVSPYLLQKNNYEPLKIATEKLNGMGLSKGYSDGIILKKPTTEKFFENIFWVTRCNMSAPEILFSALNSSIVGTLCKHGNIHFECYNHDEKSQLLQVLLRTGFNVVEDGACEEKFSSTSAIKGRMLKI